MAPRDSVLDCGRPLPILRPKNRTRRRSYPSSTSETNPNLTGVAAKNWPYASLLAVHLQPVVFAPGPGYANTRSNGMNNLRGIELPQPPWGWLPFAPVTQGGSCVATPGWRTQPRWGSRTRAGSGRRAPACLQGGGGRGIRGALGGGGSGSIRDVQRRVRARREPRPTGVLWGGQGWRKMPAR